MRQPVKALGLAALVLCATWTASCQSNTAEHDPVHEQLFCEVDADSDDRVDAMEFTRYFYVISFAHHDVDANDQLTLVEWFGENPAREEEVLFAEMDADGSDWLVLEEYCSHPARTVTIRNAFMTLDRNGDEYVEFEEIID